MHSVWLKGLARLPAWARLFVESQTCASDGGRGPPNTHNTLHEIGGPRITSCVRAFAVSLDRCLPLPPRIQEGLPQKKCALACPSHPTPRQSLTYTQAPQESSTLSFYRKALLHTIPLTKSSFVDFHSRIIDHPPPVQVLFAWCMSVSSPTHPLTPRSRNVSA